MHFPRRFDNALMLPPDALGDVDVALTRSLRAWCEGGAFPTMSQALRVTSIAPHAGLDGAACELDGSHELLSLSSWRGLCWRLHLLWRECVTASEALAGDPWDCGWWREGALGPAEAFEPRRATLLLVREPDPAVAAALISALRARSLSYRKPVRVLLVSAAAMPAGLAGESLEAERLG